MDFDFLTILKTEARLLTFRASREELTQLSGKYLLFGLFCTWLAGIGRSWDDPKAHLLQHLGIGSLAYVFVLAFILWITVRPLSRPEYPYLRMLTFVCLTSPPALLYAIPVERFLSLEVARNVNLIFLAIVAAWRVALLAFYLVRGLGLRWWPATVAVLTPLSVILSILGFFSITSSIFQAMAGLRSETQAEDPVNIALMLLGMGSMLLVLPLLVIHQGLCNQRAKQLAAEERGLKWE